MDWIKNLIAKLIGKKVGEETQVSKTKLTAVVYVVIVGIQELSKAWGHPVDIPPMVFKFLEAAGVWSLRDSIKS